MLTRESLRTKHRIVPGAVQVTYTPMAPEGTPFTINRARFKDMNLPTEAVIQGVSITSQMAMLMLPDEEMGGVKPRVTDLIEVADGDWAGVWQVASIGSGLSRAEWRLPVQKTRGETMDDSV